MAIAARDSGRQPLFRTSFARLRGLLLENQNFLGLTPQALCSRLLRRLELNQQMILPWGLRPRLYADGPLCGLPGRYRSPY